MEHVYLALIDERYTPSARLMKKYGVTNEKFLVALSHVRREQSPSSLSLDDTYDALKKYGIDLVEAAKLGKLDPVIGRDQEIRRVITILSRKQRTIPLLSVSPAWETAVVEGLAQGIARGDVPASLGTRRFLPWIWEP